MVAGLAFMAVAVALAMPGLVVLIFELATPPLHNTAPSPTGTGDSLELVT